MAGELLTVDTHALWWYLTEERPLPPRVRQALREAEQGENLILVPILVLAEILNIIRRPKYMRRDRTLAERFAEILLQLDNRQENFEIVSLKRVILERAVFLAAELERLAGETGIPSITDLRDLVFMATADFYDCPLITSDAKIRKCGLVPCFW